MCVSPIVAFSFGGNSFAWRPTLLRLFKPKSQFVYPLPPGSAVAHTLTSSESNKLSLEATFLAPNVGLA